MFWFDLFWEPGTFTLHISIFVIASKGNSIHSSLMPTKAKFPLFSIFKKRGCLKSTFEPRNQVGPQVRTHEYKNVGLLKALWLIDLLIFQINMKTVQIHNNKKYLQSWRTPVGALSPLLDRAPPDGPLSSLTRSLPQGPARRQVLQGARMERGRVKRRREGEKSHARQNKSPLKNEHLNGLSDGFLTEPLECTHRHLHKCCRWVHHSCER